MQLQREDIESIVSEVLKKLVVAAPAGAAGKGDAQGDWGVFERLEDAVAAASAAYIPLAIAKFTPSSQMPAARHNAAASPATNIPSPVILTIDPP